MFLRLSKLTISPSAVRAALVIDVAIDELKEAIVDRVYARLFSLRKETILQQS